MFKKVGVALAFSPRCQSIIAEALRIKRLFDAEIIFIHVGERTQSDEKFLEQVFAEQKVSPSKTKVIWEKGNPSKKILSVCKKEKIDLLVAGAISKENIIRYYIGSVARKILRKAKCSVMVLIDPQDPPQPFKKIVVHGGGTTNARLAIKAGVEFTRIENAFMTIIKEIRMYGLSLAIAGEESEDEYSETRRRLVDEEIKEVRSKMEGLETDGLRINIKITAGKSGHELSKFSRQNKADLIIMQGPDRKLRFLDRLFPHDLELLMADLPANLLIIHK